jgi:hypothetical protein
MTKRAFGQHALLTFAPIAERQVHFVDVDPGAIHSLLLQVRKRHAPQAPAVTLGITTRADNKIFWHSVARTRTLASTTRLPMAAGEFQLGIRTAKVAAFAILLH